MCECSKMQDGIEPEAAETPISISLPENSAITGKREQTREGFVKFHGVTIARTGEHLYGPSEIDPTGKLKPASDGLFHISRSAKELFRPATLASLHGKPFVNDHPPDDVTPETFRDAIEGVILNPRQGEGDQSDELIADILVMGLSALIDIDNGKRELSVGFQGATDHWGGGYGDHRDLIANHVALVTKARCGDRCAINDHHHEGKPKMKHGKLGRIFDSLLTGNVDEAKKIMDEDGEPEAPDYGKRMDGMGVDVAALKQTLDDHGARMDAVETGVKSTGEKMDALASSLAQFLESQKQEPEPVVDEDTASDDDVMDELPEELEKEKKKDIKDSAHLAPRFFQTRAKAEIVAPGVKLPIFDAAWTPKKTVSQSIHRLRKDALKAAVVDANTSTLVSQIAEKVYDAAAIEKLNVGQARQLFNSVAAVKSAVNTASVRSSMGGSIAASAENTGTRINDSARFAEAAKNYFKLKK